MQLQTFLERLGLSGLYETFRAEDVDDSVYTMLQDADLREFGLTLGQRKKFLAGLAAVRAEAPDGTALADGRAEDLELRRLTVVFCDMVGFTELTGRLVADLANELLQGYYRVIGREMRRFGGHVAQSQGDGIVALFGYPETRGGSAARAVEAALALQAAFAEEELVLSDGSRHRVGARIGIASGPAIVGYTTESRLADGLHMVGTVLNRAARLQALAEAGGVVVDDATRSQCEDAARYERLPDATLKGFDAPVPVSRVVGPGGPQGETHAPHTGVLSGRAAETAALAELWTRATADAPELCLLTGEAGSGKTSLLDWLAARAESDGGRLVRLACAPLGANAPLRPVIDHLSAALAGTDDPLAALGRLLGVASEAELREAGRLLHLDPGPAVPGEGGAAGRTLLLGALDRWLAGSPGVRTLVAVEDIHWADATTRELLEGLGRSPGGALMVAASSRDAAEPLWDARAEVSRVALQPLEQRAADDLVTRALGGRPIPEAYRRTILDRAGGNPLMLETLARSAERWSEAGLIADVQVPTTIYESVGARLDSIRAARRVAQMLAVFGEPVGPEVLAAASGTAPQALAPQIAELRSHGILAGESRGGEFAFQHQTYRDVIYERLVGEDRRALHRAAHDALSALVPGLAETRPETLAWHALGALDYAAAAPLALRAGERALAQSSLIEADQYLDQALAAVCRLPAGRETDALRLRALVALASVRRARLGIASDEVGALGRRVRDLARRLGERRTELVSLGGLYAYALVRADYRAAGDWARELADAAARDGDATFEMIANRAQGVVAFHTGFPAEAELGLEVSLAAYDRDRHLPLAYAHGYDHAEICCSFLAFVKFLLGDPVAARQVSDRAITHSREIGHAHSLAQALAFRTMLAAVLRDAPLAQEAGTEAAEIGDRYGLPVMGVAGSFFRDLTGLLTSDGMAAENQLAAVLAGRNRFRKVNPYNYEPLSAIVIAEIMLRSGAEGVAESMLASAAEAQERTGEIWTAPELLRVRALFHDRGGDADAAAEARRAALAAARASGATVLALRIACDIAAAEPSVAARNDVATALARMRSRDGGWDIARAEALLG